MSQWPILLKIYFPFIAVVGGLAGYWSYVFFVGEDKRALLPGKTTHGHHQVEMKCTECHVRDFERLGDVGVPNESCLACHENDLNEGNDSHPIKKFRNPENAMFVSQIDALSCVTCHREHNEKLTRPMGVTMPENYCAHCHEVTVEERDSHHGLGFETCATAGCHNYHDNGALYERFLVLHAGEPDFLAKRMVPVSAPPGSLMESILSPPEPDHPLDLAGGADDEVMREWLETAHAKAGVNCSACHEVPVGSGREWVDKPNQESCRQCHEDEVDGFLGGKHGMRLAAGLSPMTPDMARLPMKAGVGHRELSCVSCHQAHRFDRVFAAAEACMECHDDGHTRAYVDSGHYRLWQAEVAGHGEAGTGVSCATCHLPRETVEEPGGESRVVVMHNQNRNLRPNEKMVKSVCMNCHGLQFSLDQMADRSVIDANFAHRGDVQIESIDMAYARELEKRRHEESLKEKAAGLDKEGGGDDVKTPSAPYSGGSGVEKGGEAAASP
ncbi:MAG: cytochrome c3 family protein [Verrucomicrobiota bacterium]